MVQLLFASCLALGALGLTMTIFSLYVIRLNSKLEARLKTKDDEIAKVEEKLQQRNERIKEQEESLFILREQIGVKDKEIKGLRQKLISYLSTVNLGNK